jgi:hypothetical protein
MKIRNLMNTIVFLAVITMIAAGCSSGGGSTPPSSMKTTSKGVITGFGSVFVNGVEYDTTGTSVTMDDSSASETDLQVGMVVTVNGSISGSGTTGSAGSITFADNLEGPVSSVLTAASGTFAVMGQTVKVNGSTMYHNVNDASLLAVGDMVEVSGFPDASGVILATLIEKKTTLFSANTTTVELKGTVSGLSGSSFSINAMTVNAGGVTLPAGLANGSFVEVRGTLAAAGGPMTATFLELEPSFTADDGDHVEIEGIVTDYVSLSSFKVNGVPVDGSALGSVTIANNMMIEVEGTMVNGILVAGKGEIEIENNVLLEGNVSAIGANTLTLLGKTVTVTATTTYKDSSAANVRAFSFTDIAVSNHLIIDGHESGAGIVASSVVRVDASTRAQLKGIVSAKTPTTSLTILGVTVDTSAASFRDINGGTMPVAADFFAAITPGTTVVKVKWTAFTSTSAPADEADLESVP